MIQLWHGLVKIYKFLRSKSPGLVYQTKKYRVIHNQTSKLGRVCTTLTSYSVVTQEENFIILKLSDKVHDPRTKPTKYKKLKSDTISQAIAAARDPGGILKQQTNTNAVLVTKPPFYHNLVIGAPTNTEQEAKMLLFENSNSKI